LSIVVLELLVIPVFRSAGVAIIGQSLTRPLHVPVLGRIINVSYISVHDPAALTRRVSEGFTDSLADASGWYAAESRTVILADPVVVPPGQARRRRGPALLLLCTGYAAVNSSHWIC